MIKLTDIPTEDFPLNYDKYCSLREQIFTAAYCFASLDTPACRQIERELMDVHAHLGRVWETIRTAERSELEEEANRHVKI